MSTFIKLIVIIVVGVLISGVLGWNIADNLRAASTEQANNPNVVHLTVAKAPVELGLEIYLIADGNRYRLNKSSKITIDDLGQVASLVAILDKRPDNAPLGQKQ